MCAIIAALFNISLSLTASAFERKPITYAKLTVVDGDTIRCDGVRMCDMGDGAPFVSGYDTPEIGNAKCAAERALGRKAKARMAELLATKGVKVIDSGETDRRHQRPLVWIVLADGQTIESVWIAEGLAQVWTPDYVPEWC